MSIRKLKITGLRVPPARRCVDEMLDKLHSLTEKHKQAVRKNISVRKSQRLMKEVDNTANLLQAMSIDYWED